MSESVQEEVKELEKAAGETSQPEQIQQNAARAPRGVEIEASKFWLVWYLVAIGGLGAAIFWIDWQQAAN